MIATIAISSGSTPATSVPKTISRMISDAGRPKKSSPCCRSSCESFEKSSSAVSVPVIVTANALRLSACTWSTTSGMTPSAFVCSVISAALPSRETAAGASTIVTSPVASRSFATRVA